MGVGADRRIFAIRPPHLTAVAPATGRSIDFTPELRAEAIEIVEPYVKSSPAVGPR